MQAKPNRSHRIGPIRPFTIFNNLWRHRAEHESTTILDRGWKGKVARRARRVGHIAIVQHRHRRLVFDANRSAATCGARATVLHTRRTGGQTESWRDTLAPIATETAQCARVAISDALLVLVVTKLVLAQARLASKRLAVCAQASPVNAVGRAIETCGAVCLAVAFGARRVESVAVGRSTAVTLVGAAMTVGVQAASIGAARLRVGALGARCQLAFACFRRDLSPSI